MSKPKFKIGDTVHLVTIDGYSFDEFISNSRGHHPEHQQNTYDTISDFHNVFPKNEFLKTISIVLENNLRTEPLLLIEKRKVHRSKFKKGDTVRHKNLSLKGFVFNTYPFGMNQKLIMKTSVIPVKGKEVIPDMLPYELPYKEFSQKLWKPCRLVLTERYEKPTRV